MVATLAASATEAGFICCSSQASVRAGRAQLRQRVLGEAGAEAVEEQPFARGGDQRRGAPGVPVPPLPVPGAGVGACGWVVGLGAGCGGGDSAWASSGQGAS